PCRPQIDSIQGAVRVLEFRVSHRHHGSSLPVEFDSYPTSEILSEVDYLGFWPQSKYRGGLELAHYFDRLHHLGLEQATRRLDGKCVSPLGSSTPKPLASLRPSWDLFADVVSLTTVDAVVPYWTVIGCQPVLVPSSYDL